MKAGIYLLELKSIGANSLKCSSDHIWPQLKRKVCDCVAVTEADDSHHQLGYLFHFIDQIRGNNDAERRVELFAVLTPFQCCNRNLAYLVVGLQACVPSMLVQAQPVPGNLGSS